MLTLNVICFIIAFKLCYYIEYIINMYYKCDEATLYINILSLLSASEHKDDDILHVSVHGINGT